MIGWFYLYRVNLKNAEPLMDFQANAFSKFLFVFFLGGGQLVLLMIDNGNLEKLIKKTRKTFLWQNGK